MKKLSETYKELEIAFSFPIRIKDANGKTTYYEDGDDYWRRYERDAGGYVTYFENSDGFWCRYERDAGGYVTYLEDSNGFWCKYEYDAKGNETYYENSDGKKQGTPRSSKTCDGKVVVVDGIKYKLQAL